MRLPTGLYRGTEYYAGAREFWRNHLQRLKFSNPSLHCNVETVRSGENEPLYLSITYESPDREALSKLNLRFPKPLQRTKPLVRTRTEGDKQIQETSPVPKELKNPPSPDAPLPRVKTLTPVQMTAEIRAHAPKDEIKAKAQPAADPSGPQTTSAPETVFTRTVTLPLGGLRANEVWLWMRQQLDLHHETLMMGKDKEEWVRLARFRAEADKDRQRVKTGIDAMKREKLELKKARENAAKMAAEA